MKEEWAREKAEEIVRSHEADILHIVNFLKTKIKRINESVVDPNMKYNEFVNLFRSPGSGLARFEANQLIAKLLVVQGSGGGGAGGSGGFATSLDAADDRTTSGQGQGQHHTGHFSHSVKTPKASSFTNSQSSKQYRSHFTTAELHEAVYEARRISVMRGLMEEIDSSSTRNNIAKALQEEAKMLKKKGDLAVDSPFLPVKSCFKVLEEMHDLRLNRSQILFIISWADCYDKEGSSLDVIKFADHAANIVVKLGVKELMETRAEVVAQGSFDEKKVLNGMREGDLESHLESAFTALNAENDLITPEQLRDVLKDIPRLNLNERDCTALMVPFDHAHMEEGVFNWKEHVHSIVSMIITHCRERIIHRRMSLHVSSSMSDLNNNRPMSSAAIALHEEAKNQLKQLADKLLNFVKIQMVGDNMIIHLPIDNEKRRASQMGFGDDMNSNQSLNQPSMLYQGVRWIEWTTSRAVVVPAPRQSVLRNSISAARNSTLANATTTSSGSNAAAASSVSTPTAAHAAASHAAAALTPTTQTRKTVNYECVSSKKIPVFVSIMTAETGAMQVATSLVCRVISSDGTVRLQCPLPVKMPSIGVVDREAARQFAGNVVDKMYVDEVIDQKAELKMRD